MAVNKEQVSPNMQIIYYYNGLILPLYQTCRLAKKNIAALTRDTTGQQSSSASS